MKKSDLDNRMVLECANGKRYMVVDDLVMSTTGYNSLSMYNDDLEVGGDPTFNVVRVYGEIVRLLDIDNTNILTLLWERKWKPVEGELYYVANPTDSCLYSQDRWAGYGYEEERYDKGLVFKTLAEAIECADQMLEAIKEEM